MKILSFFIFILSLSFSCNKSCRSNKNEEILRIGTNATFVPYESVNEKGKLEGFDIDLGYALGDALKKKVVFKEFDFDALILALKKNQIDMILSALSITKERQKEIDMVSYQGEPVKDISFLFWSDIKNPISNFEDLKKLSLDKKLNINVQAGHFLEDFLKQQGIPTKPLAGPPEQILDIKYQKSLAAAVDPSNGKKLKAIHPELKMFSLSLPEDKWDLGYGIGLRKSDGDLKAKIEKALEELKTNGTIKQLEEKWLYGK